MTEVQTERRDKYKSLFGRLRAPLTIYLYFRQQGYAVHRKGWEGRHTDQFIQSGQNTELKRLLAWHRVFSHRNWSCLLKGLNLIKTHFNFWGISLRCFTTSVTKEDEGKVVSETIQRKWGKIWSHIQKPFCLTSQTWPIHRSFPHHHWTIYSAASTESFTYGPGHHYEIHWTASREEFLLQSAFHLFMKDAKGKH